MTPTIKRFVILFHPRAGSSWLISMLASQAEWKVTLGEPLNDLFFEQEQVRWIEDYFKWNTNKPVYGFKVAPYQIINKVSFIKTLNSVECNVILLTRENPVKAAISQVRARYMNQRDIQQGGHGRTNIREGDDPLEPLEIDQKEFIGALRQITTEKNNVDLIGGQLDRRITLTYEELLAGPEQVCKRIASFLSTSVEQPKSQLRKMTPDSLEQAVPNYRELRQLLVAHGLSEYLD